MYTHVFRVLRMEPKASCLVLCHWVTLKSLPCVFRKEDSQVTYSLSEAKKGIIYKAAAAAIPHAAQVNVQGSNWFDALYFKPIPTAFKRTEGFKAMWIPGASLWCHITNTHHLNEGWRRGVIRFFFQLDVPTLKHFSWRLAIRTNFNFLCWHLINHSQNGCLLLSEFSLMALTWRERIWHPQGLSLCGPCRFLAPSVSLLLHGCDRRTISQVPLYPNHHVAHGAGYVKQHVRSYTEHGSGNEYGSCSEGVGLEATLEQLCMIQKNYGQTGYELRRSSTWVSCSMQGK